jgi:cell wall assembly regulator SMI1
VQDIFSATLIVLDCGLLSFDNLRKDLSLHKVELVQGRDVITSLQAHDGQEYSEAEVVGRILEVKESMQLHCWEQASRAYDGFVLEHIVKWLSFYGKSRSCCRSC